MNVLPPVPGAPIFLVCAVRGALLGVPALAVREITPLPAITRLSDAHGVARAVLNVRGQVLPVFDAASLLGGAPSPPDLAQSLLILEQNGRFAALIVDGVRDVLPLPTHPKGVDAAPGGSIIGKLASVEGEIAQILDLEALFERRPAATVWADGAAESTGASEAEIAILRERAAILALPMEAAGAEVAVAGQERVQLATVALGGEFFGLELSVVREFSPLRALAPVPGAPPPLAGVMNLRGETLPLLDLRPALGLDSAASLPTPQSVVVVESQGIRAGILVDEVQDVWSVAASQIAPPPATSRAAGELLCGALFTRGNLISLLDIARFLQNQV